MILKRLKAALAGRSLWLRLDRKYGINSGGRYVLLMPEDDQELNERALRHIDELLAYRRSDSVIILTDRPWVLENAAGYSEKILAVHQITEKDTDRLLSFYELYEFTERLLTVSLYKPYGRKVWKTIGVRGITKEDVICICIYQIRDWRPEKSANGNIQLNSMHSNDMRLNNTQQDYSQSDKIKSDNKRSLKIVEA